LILAINKDESGATLNADKVDIEANDVLNILAGNEINLTTKNLSINSDNFSVDNDGNATMNNATINGGSIELNGSETQPKFRINNFENNSKYTEYFPNNIRMWNNGLANLQIGNILPTPLISMWYANDDTKHITISPFSVFVEDGTNYTRIEAGTITVSNGQKITTINANGVTTIDAP
jgi:hypothetical protein